MASSPRVTYFERDFDFETHAAEVEKSWDPERGGGPAPARELRRVSAAMRSSITLHTACGAAH